MTLQNRVTPFGSIVASPARGAWMGNRGRLHDGHRRLTRRRWTTRAWLICQLRFKGRRRPVMAPNRYTELFFLDEATALAAGHRPCAECRRPDYRRFRALWGAATGRDPATLRVADIDGLLHRQRLLPLDDPARRCQLSAMPDGAFVALPDTPDAAWLLRAGRLWRWSPEGYAERRAAGAERVVLLTPPATVAVLARGYRPQIDASAVEMG